MLAPLRDDLFFYLLRFPTWVLGCMAFELLQGRIPASFKTGLPIEECALTDVRPATGFGNVASCFPYLKQ